MKPHFLSSYALRIRWLGLFLLMLTNANAQVYTGNVTLYSQEAIDTMINYSSITGSVRIDAYFFTHDHDYDLGSNIKNIDGLSNITSIGGSLAHCAINKVTQSSLGKGRCAII